MAVYDFVNNRGNPGTVNKMRTPTASISKSGGGVNAKQLRRCKNMSKEEMIAEIQRVLEDANEWDVRDVYEYVMDEVA